MATRLRLRFRSQQLALAFRAIAFAGLLAFARAGDFELIPILLFAAAAIALYAAPSQNTFSHLGSFLVLAASALIAAAQVPFGVWLFVLLAAAAFLLYALLGLKQRYFVYRGEWHYLFTLSLLYLGFLLFFSAERSSFFSVKIVAIFLASFLLWREFFSALAVREAGEPDAPPEDGVREKGKRMIRPAIPAAFLSFLSVEALWGIALLPLTYLHAANLSLLTAITLGNVTRSYYRQTLTPRTALGNATIFILVAILIFATSTWSL